MRGCFMGCQVLETKFRSMITGMRTRRCGHCKTLAPAYEKVGKAFKDDPTVIVAKMDATANDIPDTKKYPVRSAGI